MYKPQCKSCLWLLIDHLLVNMSFLLYLIGVDTACQATGTDLHQPGLFNEKNGPVWTSEAKLEPWRWPDISVRKILFSQFHHGSCSNSWWLKLKKPTWSNFWFVSRCWNCIGDLNVMRWEVYNDLWNFVIMTWLPWRKRPWSDRWARIFPLFRWQNACKTLHSWLK